jgi:predicted ATPase
MVYNEPNPFLNRISVSNFKSYKHIDIKLDKFNVIIGANASGKSNFVNIFRFLKDICTIGLDNAISMQGGIEYLVNMNSGLNNDLKIKIEIVLEVPFDMVLPGQTEKAIGLKNLNYSFTLSFSKDKLGYDIKEERVEGSFDFKIPEKNVKGRSRNWTKIKEGTFIVTIDDKGQMHPPVFEPIDIPLKVDDLFPLLQMRSGEIEELPKIDFKELKIIGFGDVYINRYFSMMGRLISRYLNTMSIFDIDPKLCKKATPITGKTRLEADGSNLAIVLKKLLSNKEQEKRFSTILSDLLPFIESMSVERQSDTSVITCIKETHCSAKNFPAPLISDGTINLMALVIGLFFEKSPLLIIEEPERNIHPQLISKIVDMMKDVTERMDKQIIITTHNPELIKHTNIDSILLANREEGYSQLTRPSEKSTVREFLRNNLGVEDLFVQDLLK